VVTDAALQLDVELFGVAGAEVSDPLDAEQAQVGGYGRPDAGDPSQLVCLVS
jgi:hypothetical protein